MILTMTSQAKDSKKQQRIPEDFPCKEEKLLSMKCLDRYNYDYTKCNTVFHNFNFCMEFWDKVKKMRRANQIKPILPPPEERIEILRIYRTTGKYPEYSHLES